MNKGRRKEASSEGAGGPISFEEYREKSKATGFM